MLKRTTAPQAGSHEEGVPVQEVPGGQREDHSGQEEKAQGSTGR